MPSQAFCGALSCCKPAQGASVSSSFINFKPCLVVNTPNGINIGPAGVVVQPEGMVIFGLISCSFSSIASFQALLWELLGLLILLNNDGLLLFRFKLARSACHSFLVIIWCQQLQGAFLNWHCVVMTQGCHVDTEWL